MFYTSSQHTTNYHFTPYYELEVFGGYCVKNSVSCIPVTLSLTSYIYLLLNPSIVLSYPT